MKKESKLFNTFRYLCLSFVVVIGLVAIIGTGGGGGGGGGDDNDVSNVVLPETTKVLNDSTLQHLSSVSPDGSIFSFDESTPQLDSLSSNDVIVVKVTDVTPYGALRKVTSVSKVGDEVVVETTQATLEDAIESGTIEVARALTASDIQSASALIKGIALKTHSAISQADGVLHVDMNNVVLYDEDGNLGTTNDQIRASGAIDIDPSFEFKLEMDWFTIEELSFTNNTTETANLELSSQIVIDTHNEVEIARYYFTPITVSILVITPIITVNVGFDGEVSVGITTSVTQTATLTAGLSYYSTSGWEPVHDFSNEFQFNPPVLFAAAAVKGYAGPQLSLLLYGVTGPYSDINGYLELNTDLFGDPWWELYGGLFVDLGVKVDIIGNSLLDYYIPVLDYKIKLADSNGPMNNPPTADITSPSDGSEYDEGDTIIFNGTGDDPEDGSLTGGSLVWTSSRDGQIGTGTYFTRDNLSVGTHTITLTATDSQGATGTESVNITVNPIGCVYSIAPTSENIGSNGDTGTVLVTTSSSCTWKASSNDSWIIITGGSSGWASGNASGNGYINYSVSANDTGAARTGTLNIAANTFTVYQSVGNNPPIYSPVTGHWYQLNDTQMNWADAKAFAESLGGYLATITSGAEGQWLYDAFGSDLRINSGSRYFGGNDLANEGLWQWITGETWSYSNWYSGEPNNLGDEDCVALHPYLRSGHGHYWNDINCSAETCSLIEYDSDPN
ncbi:MAG: hypothetical protein JRD05_06300 [Deltaproteobacteria bacterium]|nr:hypothetical protein [Deltaproteobacteria bacterium]